MITAGELSAELHKHLGSTFFSRFQREMLEGIKAFKIPVVGPVTATQATFTLAAPAGTNPPGPDSGYIWRVERINVNSSSIGDAGATWSLFSSSDPGNLSVVNMVDSGAGNGGTVGRIRVNQAYYPGNNKGLLVFPGEQLYALMAGATAGIQYSLTGIIVEAPIEMQGKIIGG